MPLISYPLHLSKSHLANPAPYRHSGLMLTLSLLRHAKSSWSEPALDDHERPLAKRGTKAATKIGKFLAKNLPPISHVLCSDAVRTRATLTLLLAKLPQPRPRIEYQPALYLATPATYFNHISSCPSTAHHLLVIGHNPGIHMLALELTETGSEKDLAALAGKFPTAALAVIEFDYDHWRDIARAQGVLRRFITPKALAQG